MYSNAYLSSLGACLSDVNCGAFDILVIDHLRASKKASVMQRVVQRVVQRVMQAPRACCAASTSVLTLCAAAVCPRGGQVGRIAGLPSCVEETGSSCST